MAPPSPSTAALLGVVLLAAAGGCVDVVPPPSAFAQQDAALAGHDANATTDAPLANDARIEDAMHSADKTDVQTRNRADATPRADEDGTSTPLPNPCAGKRDKTPCDDGNACTITLCIDEACVPDKGVDLCECYQASDCAAKEDANKCNGTLYCDTTVAKHLCKVNPATVVLCAEDGNPCTQTSCDPTSGICDTTPVAEIDPKKSCEDGNKCTASDFCQGGLCQPGQVICTCTKQADCDAQEDGNACNGTLFCDTAAPTPTCKLNPATVVVCPTAQDTGCTKTMCDSQTAKCVDVVSADLSTCEDGNPCTAGDSCAKGACKPGTDLCQCKTTADCAKFDDGDACNGTLYCHAPTGTCKTNPKTVVHCTKGNTCFQESCDPKTGQCKAKHPPKFTPCDADGNPCTVDDTCDGGGKCEAGTDVCVCEANSDCAKKDDGNPCTGTLYCDKLAKPPTCKPNPKTIVQCPPSTKSCELQSCSAKTGTCETTKVADYSGCDDNDKCTVGDVCQAGSCVPGPDLCACSTDSDCLDDGNVCNGIPYCDKTATPTTCKTKPGSKVSCQGDDGTPIKAGGCLLSLCDPATGQCAATAVAGFCKDENACKASFCDSKTGLCSASKLADGTLTKSGACLDGKPLSTPAAMLLVGDAKLPMGCNKMLDTGCKPDELPQHDVQVSAFWLDQFEVTAGAYASCVAVGNCPEPKSKDKACNHTDPKRSAHPANCVNWSAAAAFCKHMAKRLPTEAEWELAARGGCAKAPLQCAQWQPMFPWGLPVATCAFAVLKSDAGDGCGLGTTRAVGTFVKDVSPWNLRDMGGNVAEWVADWYDKQYYQASAATDPPGAATGTMKVARGGHFQADAAQARASKRTPVMPTDAVPWLGFRCARDVTP